MIQCSTNCIWGGRLVPYHLFLTVSVTEVSWVLEIPSLSVQLIKTCYYRFSDLVTIELRLVVRNHWSFDEVPWGTRFQTKSWEDNKSQTHFMESQNYTDWGGNLFREEEMCFYFEVVQRTLTKDACLHVHVIFCLQHNKTFRTSCCPRLNEVRRREG